MFLSSWNVSHVIIISYIYWFLTWGKRTDFDFVWYILNSFMKKGRLTLTQFSQTGYSAKLFWAAIPYAWVNCECNLGARKAVSHLVGLKCTTIVGSIGEALVTITFKVFLRPHNGNFWTVATIYHNLKKNLNFSSTHRYTNL